MSDNYLTAIEFAREQRKNATDAEQLCWFFLRDRRVLNVKFRRQHPMPPYTLDFYSVALKLAIELDGSQHVDSESDKIRDKFLAKKGIEVIQIFNNDFLQSTEVALEYIYSRVEARLKMKEK